MSQGTSSGEEMDEQMDEEMDEERTVIKSGRKFEEEYRLSASETGEFLIDLGTQLRDEETLTIVEDDWELPFSHGEPINMEIDFDGTGEQELEIELEMPGRSTDSAPDVE